MSFPRKASIVRIAASVSAAAVLALATPGTASTQAPLASLVGTVRDTNGTPIAKARLSTGAAMTLSDSTGRFMLAGLPGGNTTLVVRRLGFEPLDVTLDLVAGVTQSLEVVLTYLPQDLPGMTTTATIASEARLRDFYRHRQSGMGYFLDRKEIESKHVVRISDILRRIPGTRISSDRAGRQRMSIARNGIRDCPPDVWVDGIRAYGMQVDDLPLSDVEALELYRGPAGLPPELNSRLGNPACGALVIWTRVPGL
jgi:Carboxypeptidase regulatory-like domain/TonB-dependent Receptor Plug Domain